MGFIYLIAFVFGMIIFLVLISLISLNDQRAKVRLRTRLFSHLTAPPIAWKKRLLSFLDTVKIPTRFSQLVDKQTVIWSGIEMTLYQFQAFWWLLSLLGVILGLIVLLFSPEIFSVGLLAFALVLFLAIGPFLYLKYRIRERERVVERSLPDFLDMLTFTVEAGLGLVPALYRVTTGFKGTLSEELQQALIQIELGFSQREALEELVMRVPSSDVEHFVEAILLSERLGTSLARTMRVQANLLRTRRRQRAEAKAQTAPIRIIPALVFFFLPSLLLIYLAPPIINFLFRR